MATTIIATVGSMKFDLNHTIDRAAHGSRSHQATLAAWYDTQEGYDYHWACLRKAEALQAEAAKKVRQAQMAQVNRQRRDRARAGGAFGAAKRQAA